MLGQTLFLVTVIALFAASMIAGVAGYARVEAANAAKALIAPALETALARYESTVLAPAIAAAYAPGDGSADPPPAAALDGAHVWNTQTYVLAATPATFAVVVTVTPTSPGGPACLAPGAAANAGPDTERSAQCSPFVQESRLSLALTADAGPLDSAATVAPLVHDRTTVTLRLFAQPPFATVAGVWDAAAAGDPHEADVDGYGNASGAFGPAPVGDTTIHVIYACTPAVGDCTASHPQPADRPTSLPWTNGN